MTEHGIYIPEPTDPATLRALADLNANSEDFHVFLDYLEDVIDQLAEESLAQYGKPEVFVRIGERRVLASIPAIAHKARAALERVLEAMEAEKQQPYNRGG